MSTRISPPVIIGILCALLLVVSGVAVSVISKKGSEINILQEDLKKRDAKLSQLEQQIKELDAAKAALEKTKLDLEGMLTKLEQELDSAKVKEAGLSKQVEVLSGENKKLEGDLVQTMQLMQDKLKIAAEENKKALDLKAEKYLAQEKTLLTQIEDLKQKLTKIDKEKKTLEKKSVDIADTLAQEQSKLEHYKRGLSYENEKNYKDAVKEYEEILKIDPQDANVYLRLASIYVYGIKDPERADYYTKAYAVLMNTEGPLKPKDIALPVAKTVTPKKAVTVEPTEAGQKPGQQKQRHAPGEKLNSSIDTFEAKALRHHYNLALVYDNEEKYQEAVQEYEKTLEFAPYDADIHYNLAILYDDKLQDKKKAILHYEKYLENNPSADDAQKVQSWIADAQEDLDWQWKMR